MAKRCPATVEWWDLGSTLRCTLAPSHEGPHADGVRWFNDDGQQYPLTEPATVTLDMPCCPCPQHRARLVEALRVRRMLAGASP